MHTHIAEAMRDNGQALAMLKTGMEWKMQAIDCLRTFTRHHIDHADREFTFEQFRLHAEQSGLASPASMNAWGALPRVAVAAGICTPTEKVVRATRRESHARMIRVWRAA